MHKNLIYIINKRYVTAFCFFQLLDMTIGITSRYSKTAGTKLRFDEKSKAREKRDVFFIPLNEHLSSP